jgi:hypothetical protein
MPRKCPTHQRSKPWSNEPPTFHPPPVFAVTNGKGVVTHEAGHHSCFQRSSRKHAIPVARGAVRVRAARPSRRQTATLAPASAGSARPAAGLADEGAGRRRAPGPPRTGPGTLQNMGGPQQLSRPRCLGDGAHGSGAHTHTCSKQGTGPLDRAGEQSNAVGTLPRRPPSCEPAGAARTQWARAHHTHTITRKPGGARGWLAPRPHPKDAPLGSLH